MIYITGSLRNPEIPKIAKELTDLGLHVFADWFAAGDKADDAWRDYERSQGRTFEQALEGPAARNVFEFDRKWLDRANAVLLVLPAGKSAFMEAGYAAGKGKYVVVLLDDPERWDVMLQFADVVTSNRKLAFLHLRQHQMARELQSNKEEDSHEQSGTGDSRRTEDGAGDR